MSGKCLQRSTDTVKLNGFEIQYIVIHFIFEGKSANMDIQTSNFADKSAKPLQKSAKLKSLFNMALFNMAFIENQCQAVSS